MEGEGEKSFFMSQEVTIPKHSFPGPAGLLPKNLKRQRPWATQKSTPTVENKKKKNDPQTTSMDPTDGQEQLIMKKATMQHLSTVDVFSIDKGPWKTLVNSLNLNVKDPQNIMCRHGIDWLKRNMYKLNEATMKIPFLLAIVVKKDLHDDTHLVLMDISESIDAILNPSVLKQYKGEINPGTALVLRNVPFLKSKNQLVVLIGVKHVMMLAAENENGKVNITSNGELQLTLLEGEFQNMLKKRSQPTTNPQANAFQQNKDDDHDDDFK